MPPKRSRFRYLDARWRGLAASVLGVATSGCLTNSADLPAEDDQGLPLAQMQLDITAVDEVPTASVCSSEAGRYHCFAHVYATTTGHAQAFAVPIGFGATELQAAYNIPQTVPGTPTVAIVTAYGYPQLEADLAAYRTQYGLPACSVANGCLKIVNQTGGTTPLPAPPPVNDDWTLETALDIDMASAACPKCKLLVVQANDNLGNGLEVGQNTAAALGATVISDSWGGPEQPGQSLAGLEATYFNHPGVATFAAAGDAGYNDGGKGPDYPGTSAHVVAVGGTTLVRDQNSRGFSETAWGKGGSACSLSIPKPAYQTTTGCNFKATADVAAVGNPQTGVAVYNAHNGGWQVIGGTSAAAPFIAGLFAAAGIGNQVSGEFIKANAAKLFDVTSGTNGTCPSPILCTAGVGWDGPTGYGTPNASAFVRAGGSGIGPGTGASTGGDVTGSNANSDRDAIGGCAVGGTRSGFAFALALVCAALRRRPRHS